MNSLWIAFFALGSFYLAYRFYAGFLSRRIFGLDADLVTPSHAQEDGIDFVPTQKAVLFGHHFTSIAGASPIVGPAIAVIYGWLPALLWIVLGTIFIGGVHDLGALVVSLRHQGRSIGELTHGLVGDRARTLFLFIIFFLLLIVLAVFALVIALLFIQYPETVLPTWGTMVIAVVVGMLIHRGRIGALSAAAVSVVLIYLLTYLGTLYPVRLGETFLGSAREGWIVLILLYSFFAAVLPVWLLLQPRDFINAQGLFLGLAFMYGGLFILRPEIVAPAVSSNPSGAPPLFPFLFIIVACGAVSGFHCLVSSGTSVRQIDKETDARLIGYGSMVGEGVLAVMAVLACTAGFETKAAWNLHYINWNAAQGLSQKIAAFVSGGSRFIAACGIPGEFAQAVVGVIIISFAMTTIDTATRLQRYVIGEIGGKFRIAALKNRYLSGGLAVVTAYFLVISKGAGSGGMTLWPLFGTTNQLLAGLALLVITIYLKKCGKNGAYTFFAMLFVLGMTLWAMVVNINLFYSGGNWLLVSIGSIIFILALWLCLEAWFSIRRKAS
jgi:carbon starvation protein